MTICAQHNTLLRQSVSRVYFCTSGATMKTASSQSCEKINVVTKDYKGEFLTEILKSLNINTDLIRRAETQRHNFK